MAMQVVSTAMLMCPFGMAPSTLTVIPTSMVSVSKMPAATIMDFKPMANIPPFGMCMTPSNPTVAAATAAALGVLTPMPCVPVTTPWVPGIPNVSYGKMPAIDITCKCMCSWGGVITVTSPGQVQTSVA